MLCITARRAPPSAFETFDHRSQFPAGLQCTPSGTGYILSEQRLFRYVAESIMHNNDFFMGDRGVVFQAYNW